MAQTRPHSDQIRFQSASTGEHVLDDYLEAAEKGGRTLGDMLSDIFTNDGVYLPDTIEFRVSAGVLQYRVGTFIDPNAGWSNLLIVPELGAVTVQAENAAASEIAAEAAAAGAAASEINAVNAAAAAASSEATAELAAQTASTALANMGDAEEVSTTAAAVATFQAGLATQAAADATAAAGTVADAEDFAGQAQASATAAASSRTLAQTSASNAQQAATNLSTAVGQAAASATSASNSAAAAAQSAIDASAAAGGGVTTFNGRSGIVNPVSSDYSAFHYTKAQVDTLLANVSGSVFVFDDAPPASPADGARWVDSTSMILYTWVDDAWVDLSGVWSIDDLDVELDGPIPNPLDGLSPTSAYSMSRNLLSAHSAPYYTVTSDRISAVADQSGFGRNLAQATAGNRPVLGTSGGVPMIDFDGASRFLEGPNLSNYIAANSGYMVVSFLVRTATISSQAGAAAHRVISDAAEGGSIMVNAGPTVKALQFDGAYKQTTRPLIAFNAPLVASFRKDATTMYIRVNLGDEVSAPIGNLTALNYAFRLSDTGTNDLDGAIFEVATWTTVPDEATRDIIVTEFMKQAGVEFPVDLATYPNATNTGYSGTLTPSSGTLTITTAGAIVENLDHEGNIVINANNVTLRNCRIRANTFNVVQISLGRTGVIVEDCEIDGLGGSNAPTLLRGSGTFRRNNIHSGENGIVIEGASGCLVEDNWVHSLLTSSAEPHYDNMELNGGQVNTTIRHNTLDLSEHPQTAAINANNYFGALDQLLIQDNYLLGGGYTLYVDGQFTGGVITNVQILDNKFEPGIYSAMLIRDATPTITGNVHAVTGLPITA